jgi:multidrug efflux pump subunit AcrB
MSGAAEGRDGSTGISRTGTSREKDIRRTATGALNLSPQQIQDIRKAVSQAKLERQDSVAFTVVVGAAVPAQAGAREGEHHRGTDRALNWFEHFHQRSERGFELFRRGYLRVLTMLLKRRLIIPVVAELMLVLGGVAISVSAGSTPPINRAPASVKETLRVSRANEGVTSRSSTLRTA